MAGDRRLFQYEPGKPVGFHLHSSIKKEYQRENLTHNIVVNGGKILSSPSGADTVLVDEKRLKGTRETLQTTYSLSRDESLRGIVVEPMRFIQDCIRHKRFIHQKPTRYAMGGYVGRSRTEFTKKDDDNLCWYLSRRIPDSAEGGRLSIGVYKELMLAAEIDPELAWAKRHTAESWRERYKKRRERLDPKIQQYATSHPPEYPALYSLSRLLNKNNRLDIKHVKQTNDEIIEISDNSGHEEESDFDVKPQQRNRPLEKDWKPSKRRRIDSSDISSPFVTPTKEVHMAPSSAARTHAESSSQNKVKGKEVERDMAETAHPSLFTFPPAPAPDIFEGGPSQPRRAAIPGSQKNLVETPAPSPTLVQRASPRVMLPLSPPMNRRSPAVAPSPHPSHPSTSFRDVAHSSPAFVSASPHRSGVRSHNTSTTEPSSRSMVVPPELAPLPQGVANAPAESSITRESSHKRSSPILPPVRKVARKRASRPPAVIPSSDEEEGDRLAQQVTAWAPYRNTRSRSHSVEPAPLRAARKKTGRRGRVRRNDAPLAPVVEGEAEQEQGRELEKVIQRNQERIGVKEADGVNKREVISTTMTETMQEEHDVADLLMVDSKEVTSGTMSNKMAEGGDEESRSGEETEDEGEGEPRIVVQKEEEEDVDESEEEEEETAKFETVPEGNTVDVEDEEGDELSTQDAFNVPSSEETSSILEAEGNTLDIFSLPSEEKVVQQKLSSSITQFKGQSLLDSDDDAIDRMMKSPSAARREPAKTVEELLASYGSSSKGSSLRRQRKSLNTYLSGSPSPLQAQNQNRARQSFPILKPTQTRLPEGSSKSVLVQRLGGFRRVSFGSSSPSLPRTPVVLITQPPGPRVHSSSRQSLSLSPTKSRHSRRSSVESTSSAASFPLSGTRASAVKAQIEQALKESPYTPPSGTKAAAVMAARQRLRPRKR